MKKILLYGKPTSLNSIPFSLKKESLNITNFFHVPNKISDWNEWKEIFKQAKTILNSLRWTKLTDYQAQFEYKVLRGSAWKSDFSEAALSAKEEANDSVENWSYTDLHNFFNKFPWTENDLGFSLPGTFMGYRVYNSDDDEFSVNAYSTAGKLKTFFQNDFAPEIYSMCYSTKVDNEFYNSVYQTGSSYYSELNIGNSEYWSPPDSQWTEGLNFIRLGNAGLEKQFEIFPSPYYPDFTQINPPPKNTYGFYGSFNIWCFICDWHGSKGFKFK